MVILAAALFLFFAPSALAGLCPCDCDGDQSVRVHELLTGVNISFDRLEMSHCPPADADGNGSVGINDLVAGVGSALHGCPPHPPPTRTPIANTTAEEVSAARALWQSLGLHHYEYRVRVTCFCRGPLDVVMEVFDDRIVAFRDPHSGEPIPSDFFGFYFTVDGLFDFIEGELPRAEVIRVEFATSTGVPTSVILDTSFQIADDELTVVTSDLRPLTEQPACRTDADCSPSFAICVEPGGFAGCGFCFDHQPECDADDDCGAGNRVCGPVGYSADTCACDPTVSVCKPGCNGDGDCAVGESCSAHRRCVAIACDDIGACPAHFSCISPAEAITGECRRTECSSDTDCAADAGFCVSNKCHPRPGHCAIIPP